MISVSNLVGRLALFAGALVAPVLVAPVLVGNAPVAHAMGGSAAQSNGSLKAHLVMVLSRQANRHGACTGTVIAPDVVLTAAHCVVGNKQLAIAYPEDDSHVLQRVRTKAINPGFSSRARVSVDIALIKLDSPLPARFVPLRMDSGLNTHAIGLKRQMAGYGLVAERSENSGGVLRSAQVSILPKLYPRFMRLGRDGATSLSDFAVCTGDSGGPVLDGDLVVGVIYGREKFGHAQDCGTTAQAVRLAPQSGWISSVLAKWGGRSTVSSSRPLDLTR